MEFNWEVISKIASALATISAAIIAAYIAKRYQQGNLDLSREKMEKELFTEFNRRYDELNDSLLMLDDSMTIDDLKDTPSKIENKTLYNVIVDYFNLCAEQHYWKQNKRISNKIWKGMMHYFNSFPVVRELWKDEIEGDGYKSHII
ncbi:MULTISPECIES: hypothetical protein [Myroides]|uniref:hypothetical protein n=1 Tax=Myroides TaxID=76831 RepID=UPI0025778F81|nr:hypothetical protein [Myroides marinus]MDM1383507.1 hypothetical protein [Myroides marinus]